MAMQIQERITESHLIDGGSYRGKTYTVEGPFDQYPLQFELPRLTYEHVNLLTEAVQQADIPPLKQRQQLIGALANYEPSHDVLASVCQTTGMPISWIHHVLSDGRRMAAQLAEAESSNGHKTVFVGISPTDPREYFFFFAHFLLAGTPAIVKLSSWEPVLGRDIVRFLQDQGLPADFLNIIYADSSNQTDSRHVLDLINAVDLPIVMGDAQLVDHQLSFNAEHSRGLILDADQALPHLEASIRAPNSCLAEHNYLVVGENNFSKVKDALLEIYANLNPGDLLDPDTTLGLADPEAEQQVATLLTVTTLADGAIIHHPAQYDAITADLLSQGVVTEHFPEDPGAGMNPLMTTSLPTYITCLRHVPDVEEAHRELALARQDIEEKYDTEKSMALGIYAGDGDGDKLRDQFQDIAFDIPVNSSPIYVDGWVHQGIDLNATLSS